ncbi:MAG TPA: patatin-like phospholipase family protein [Ideonella sp.]|uniref:patatin-like phospholipase family protein n=1 Tax=Ideonella sp. TaxID=1929293 RepID=UPI002CC7DF66|nr:patatin-like phospholipase family protein [Ideonella sp.]HSI48634.1 patatin-like phospholipase family protein [Ideonella sp.]
MPRRPVAAPSRSPIKTVVLFQGGGPLGAFGCGAWQALAPWLAASGHELIAVAGASIGALNACTVATAFHSADHGRSQLQQLWEERIAMPSFPFLGLPLGDSLTAQQLRATNGLLTGLLWGNRGLFHPEFANWNVLGALRRRERPLYRPLALQQLFETLVGSEGYRSRPGEGPMLAVAATDVASGRLRLFCSDDEAVQVPALTASAAMPLMFPSVEMDGRLYWDGEVSREPALQLLWERLCANGRVQADEPVQLVTIEQFAPAPAELPLSSIAMLDRTLHLLMFDKLAPQPLLASRFQPWLRIMRPSLPEDGIGGQFDYSPERVARLMAQGVQQARQALAGQVQDPRQPTAGEALPA